MLLRPRLYGCAARPGHAPCGDRRHSGLLYRHRRLRRLLQYDERYDPLFHHIDRRPGLQSMQFPFRRLHRSRRHLYRQPGLFDLFRAYRRHDPGGRDLHRQPGLCELFRAYRRHDSGGCDLSRLPTLQRMQPAFEPFHPRKRGIRRLQLAFILPPSYYGRPCGQRLQC